ncbi:MAG: hypothetical protein ABIM17_03245 [candidate division WOR-3 bacterium]
MQKSNISVRFGLYLIIFLFLLKFGYEPLKELIDSRKEALGELSKAYAIKKETYEKIKRERENRELSKEVFDLLYSKDISDNRIRTELVNYLVVEAEKRGLGLINFEVSDTKKGKRLSEISALIRLKGNPKAFFEYLSQVENSKKLTVIRSLEITRTGTDFTYIFTVSVFKSEV